MNDFEDKDQWLSIGEAANKLRLSRDTLRRWEKAKTIKSYRSPTNRRYYKKEDLDYIFNKKPDISVKSPEKSEIKGAGAKKENPLALIIICLLSVYIVVTIFLAWLLLNAH